MVKKGVTDKRFILAHPSLFFFGVHSAGWKKRSSVHDCCSIELQLSALFDGQSTVSSKSSLREDTLELHVPSLKRNPIPESWPWFRLFISTALGTTDDCYISEYDLIKT